MEGIQCSGSAALGSPSVNRDMGTTKPVYISSILTGTSQPGIGGTASTLVSCACAEIHISRFGYMPCIKILDFVRWLCCGFAVFFFNVSLNPI